MLALAATGPLSCKAVCSEGGQPVRAAAGGDPAVGRLANLVLVAIIAWWISRCRRYLAPP
jgi:hypothetical protein